MLVFSSAINLPPGLWSLDGAFFFICFIKKCFLNNIGIVLVSPTSRVLLGPSCIRNCYEFKSLICSFLYWEVIQCWSLGRFTSAPLDITILSTLPLWQISAQAPRMSLSYIYNDQGRECYCFKAHIFLCL